MHRTVAPCYAKGKHKATFVCSKMLHMKTSAEIRYENLVELCAQHGGPIKVGELAGVSGDNLRQIVARTKTPAGTEKGVGDPVARLLEEALGKERGWMDHDHRNNGTGEHPDYANLKQFDIGASLGPGVLNSDYVAIKGGLQFKRSFLVEEGVDERQGEVIYAEGDSMLPTLPSGSVVLINRGERRPKHGKVYLILDRDDGLRIKRLLRDENIWIIASDNENRRSYPNEKFDEERHSILGKAVWFGSRL